MIVLTAIEHPLKVDLSTSGASSVIAETLTPLSRRASVMLKSGGSNVLWDKPPATRAAYRTKTFISSFRMIGRKIQGSKTGRAD